MPGLFAGDDGLIAGEPTVVDGPRFTVRARLRDDAVWSDGEPVSARDLVRTWRAARRRGASTGVLRQVLRISGAGGEVRIEFRSPTSRWRELFSDGLGVLPAHAFPEGGRGHWTVSAGPFTLARWRPGLDMLFERNERWWGSGPSLDRIRVVFVPDASAALDLFEQGRIDALGPYQAPDWQRRLADAGASVSAALPEDTTRVRLVMASRGPLASPAVRRAFVEAVDIDRIVRGLVQAEAHPGGPTPARDLAPARARLADAGWRGVPTRARRGQSLAFTLAVVSGDDLGFLVGNAIKYQAEQVGIRAELVGQADHRFWGEWLSGAEMRAALVTERRPRAPGEVLFQPVVTLASSPAFTVEVASGPRGPFAAAHRWARAR
jgi:peptide/nickel transport system substrate-binding protein